MQKLERKELAKALEQRKQFIKKVADFADKLLEERGTVTFSKIYDNYSRQKSLVEFGDFEFHKDDGYNMFGGGTIEIYQYINNRQDVIKVLQLGYHGQYDVNSDLSSVEFFSENSEWQEILLDHISRKDEILQHTESKERIKEKHRRVRHTIEEVESKLINEAVRFGFSC